jgi:hypothetical protein
MRADAWGLSAWSFAAAASIPYQLLDLLLTLVMGRDVARGAAMVPPMHRLAQLGSILLCGVAILYYGICVIYLRTPAVRRAFSGGAGTPPSA